MPTPTKIVKEEKNYHVKDDTKRPLSIVRLQFHPTEARLVAATVDCKLAVWDLDGPAMTDPKSKSTGPGVLGTRHCDHEVGWVQGFDISPDGKLIATGGSDRRLRLWRWAGGKPEDGFLAEAAVHDGWVEAVGFSPDGKLAATVGSDRALKLWNAADLKPVKALPSGHTGIPRDLAWTRDGKLLLTGGEDGKVIVRNGQTFEAVRTLDFGETNDQQGQHPNVSGVHRLAVSRDGRWAAAAGDKKLTLFDLDKGAPVAGDAVRLQAAFHPSANVLAAGGDMVKVWGYEPAQLVPKGGKLSGIGKELGAIKLGDFALGIGFSADGSLLAVGKSNGMIEIWKIV